MCCLSMFMSKMGLNIVECFPEVCTKAIKTETQFPGNNRGHETTGDMTPGFSKVLAGNDCDIDVY